MRHKLTCFLIGTVGLGLGLGCSSRTDPEAASVEDNLAAPPTPSHVVIVIEENHAFNEVIGNAGAPYMNSLAARGAVFTNSRAIEHPSLPNYLDLFSGSNQGVTDDSCPHSFSGPNLGASLVSAGRTFTGYSEDLPGVGSTVCSSGDYWRKHNPWSYFTNVPTSANQPFTSFPTDFNTLPTVSIVIPNQQHDMHDGTVGQADQWLQQHIDAYVTFATTHNALLIVTWDEDDSSASNQIPTIFVGNMVKPGSYGEAINHFSLLRTLEDMYGLPAAGQSAGATAITDVWNTVTQPDAGVGPADARPVDASTPVPDASTPAPDASTTSNFQRTVVFVFTQTQPGQDMFLRGGIDFAFAASHLGRNCNANPFDCAIPIRHRNLRNASTASLKVGDTFLDWIGPEAGQDASAPGTPLDWTTNVWPPAFGPVRTVAVDGFGVEPLNLWGLHYWMMDVDMDCSKTVDGWFELKSFVKNGAGWESDVHQAGTPYVSNNHFARCGQISRFEAGSGAADIHPF